MSNNKLSYPEPGKVPTRKPSMVDEGSQANPDENTIPWATLPDGSGRVIHVHPKDIELHMVTRPDAGSNLTNTHLVQQGVIDASKDDEIWAFAASFKYIDASTKMNVPAVHEDSTNQLTFPRTTVQSVQPAVKTDAASNYGEDGTPIPPSK